MTKLAEDTITFMPNSANRLSVKYSPRNMPLSATYWRVYTSVAAVAPYMATLMMSATGSSTNMPEKVVTANGSKVATCSTAHSATVSSDST